MVRRETISHKVNAEEESGRKENELNG